MGGFARHGVATPESGGAHGGTVMMTHSRGCSSFE
jgi:hypothetical protein